MLLHVAHLGEAVIHKRLPGICEMAMTFLGIDPACAPIPVYPTAHYTMGGIPTNRFGQVVVPVGHSEETIPGLYAVGECACVSVHGANRLGGNSLLDIVVFGRAAGEHILGYLAENRYHRDLPPSSMEAALARLARWDRGGEGETVAGLRGELQSAMEAYCGVFRSEEVLKQGLEKVLSIEARLDGVRLRDTSRVFNTARIEAFELENLVDLAVATVTSALGRRESRGAHSRVDYPGRDDQQWLKHSLFFKAGRTLEYKPVRTRPLTVDAFPPTARVY